MKSSPLLYSDPMIRAIRRKENPKTQTRRLFKDTPEDFDGDGHPIVRGKDDKLHRAVSRIGGLGDEVWIKECFGVLKVGGGLIYRADGGWADAPNFRDQLQGGKWKPSIFMGRAQSRIRQEHVQPPRIERLQDITTEDALAEGLSKCTKDGGRVWKYGVPDIDGYPGVDNDGDGWKNWLADPIQAYYRLWDRINNEPGERVDDNPWVWVYNLKEKKS